MTKTEVTVVSFGGRRTPRPLAGMRVVAAHDGASIDVAVAGARRVAVLGSDADLAAVLTRLMRSELLDVEVAHVRDGPRRWWDARQVIVGTARRVPLIRDDTGTVVVGSATWLPPDRAAALHGEAVVDDAVLFDGDVAGVRVRHRARQGDTRGRRRRARRADRDVAGIARPGVAYRGAQPRTMDQRPRRATGDHRGAGHA